AVRLLTIHAAKGLEFKVVIVADAGRDKAPPPADEILALSDGRFGFRVVDPVTSKRRGAFGWEEVREARRQEEDAEKLRLYYVAMTRAVDRLIVSGAVDRETAADASTPIGWVLARLHADEELRSAGNEPVELERGEARLLIRVDRHRPDPELVEVPAEAGRLAATEIGHAVHRLLEEIDLATPSAAPDFEQVRSWYPTATEEELERIRTFVAGYCDSDLARRVAALPGMRKEQHFTFEH